MKSILAGIIVLLAFLVACKQQASEPEEIRLVAWQKPSLDTVAVGDLVVSGTSLLACPTSGGGLLLSIDDGSSWTQVGSGLTNPGVNGGALPLDVWALAASTGNLVAAVGIRTFGFGVMHSTNNGSDWVEANNGLTNLYVACLVISSGNLYAVTHASDGYHSPVFLSSNNGTNWAEAGLVPGVTWELAASSDGSLFAATDSGVFLSTNGGSTWNSANDGLTNTALSGELVTFDANIFVATGDGVFISSNNGGSWTQTGLKDNDVWALAVSGQRLFAARTGSLAISVILFSSDNGSTWTDVSSGLPPGRVWALALSGRNLFAGGDFGVVKGIVN